MKKKIATVWLGGCSGCHMSLLDIDERILDVAALADIVKSPVVDGKEFPDVDIAIVEGAVSLDEHQHELRHIRKHSKVLVALGDCAVTGNVPAYRNFFTKEEALKRSYAEVPSNDSAVIPSDERLGRMLDRVRPLHEEVPVDYFLPGCPPNADLIFHVLFELLNDRKPDFPGGRVKHG